ncbi:hypothetical protein [Gulosibacter molinativorax]|uniref:Uncharacterized protein n=1 Tax=Gulosibacter molinativorax TaxID=256821 RepID=A0ABT7CBT6_9MICO|nr:hypothetical protein [Gulosibacter molinativorax]MDJ1372663.1 hypothetical protein [Gulosibacter molinativorax]QUY62399.1 Hypotetical protein [Gulosibacter molinativorax]
MEHFQQHSTASESESFHERNVAATSAINLDIEDAFQQQREVQRTTAHAIASILAQAIPNNEALLKFSGNEPVRNHELRAEYLPIYTDPSTPPEVRTWIDWLGSNVIASENMRFTRTAHRNHAMPPQLKDINWVAEVKTTDNRFLLNVQADIPEDKLEDTAARADRLVTKHGAPFKAFLSLFNTDPTSPTLEDDYIAAYLGTFESRRAAMLHLTNLAQWEQEITRIEQEMGFPGIASIDFEPFWDVMSSKFDHVYDEKKFHMFTKSGNEDK